MYSSKKEFVILNKLINEFISSLSESDYESLINGSSTIKLKKKELPDTIRIKYLVILKKLLGTEENKLPLAIDNLEELKTKMDKIKFCQYLNLTLLKKDTNEDIKGKIISYIISNKDDIMYRLNKSDTVENSLEEIADNLADFMDEKEAKNFLLSFDLLFNRANTYKLANILDVYVPKDKTKDKSTEEIIDLIISSVVGAKIRSYKIRNKELNS